MSISLTATLKSSLVYSNIYLWRSALRIFSTKVKCNPDNDPKCSKETLAKMKPCISKLRRLENREEIPKIRTIWENPECCKEPCPDFMPRCDELYYKHSDKKKRKYQQTWASCPKLVIKKQKICSHEHHKFRPKEKRARKIPRKSACPLGPRISLSLIKKCRRIRLPGCKGSRQPPICKTFPGPDDECKKECAPYPSYSECKRKELKKLHPSECQCLDHANMCEVWNEMRRRLTFRHAANLNK